MTAANGNNEMREWLRAQGHAVSSRGRIRGNMAELYYAEYPDRRPPGSVALLPGPDDDWDDDGAYDDIGPITLPDATVEAPKGPSRYQAVPDEPEPVTVDPGPAHGRKGWRKETPKQSFTRDRRPGRITAGIRTDINAKISLALEIPGRVWQARDPVCGGTFVEQRPAIADALTEIVCGSPDLVAWFAGQGGQFMLWFNLAMACWPVVTVGMAHHVYHTIGEEPEDATQPDYGSYAA